MTAPIKSDDVHVSFCHEDAEITVWPVVTSMCHSCSQYLHTFVLQASMQALCSYPHVGWMDGRIMNMLCMEGSMGGLVYG